MEDTAAMESDLSANRQDIAAGAVALGRRERAARQSAAGDRVNSWLGVAQKFHGRGELRLGNDADLLQQAGACRGRADDLLVGHPHDWEASVAVHCYCARGKLRAQRQNCRGHPRRAEES